MASAEREQRHRHGIEQKITGYYGQESRIGAWGAVIIAIIMSGLGGTLILFQQFGYATTVIISGVGLFFTSAIWKSISRPNKSDLQKNNDK